MLSTLPRGQYVCSAKLSGVTFRDEAGETRLRYDFAWFRRSASATLGPSRSDSFRVQWSRSGSKHQIILPDHGIIYRQGSASSLTGEIESSRDRFAVEASEYNREIRLMSAESQGLAQIKLDNRATVALIESEDCPGPVLCFCSIGALAVRHGLW